MSRRINSQAPLGAKLREARETLGMSQGEVAKLLRRTQSYVSRCETGNRRVDIDELQAFCAAYGRPLEYFVRSDLPQRRGRGR